MRFRTLVVLCLLAVLAVPAFAQEQRGAVEGVVKDSSGAVLPGVTVEATNVAVGSVVSTVTSDTGVYRFPSLQPGTYSVSATLQGFNPAKVDSVHVQLGDIKTVNLTLSVGAVSETVQVTGEAPLVDVRQSARATSIRNEQIDLLPKGRDFSTLVTQVAGANQESKLGGISIDGSSAGENRFIIDGIETTNLRTGVSGKNVIADFVEEVQVKSSGYTAEYGGATGGVINVVTKSGTNSFRGNALFNWQSDKLESSNRPILRRGVLNNAIAEYQTYPEDKYNRFEPGIAVGGPLVKDKMWFFGAYQPALTTTKRTVNPTTSGNPNANTFNDVEQKNAVQYLTANSTTQIGSKIRTRISYNNSWSKRTGLLPSQSGTDLLITKYDIDRTFPNWSLSGNLDWVTTPNLYFGFRGGYYMSDFFDAGVPNEIRYFYSQGNVGMAGVPTNFQAASSFSNLVTNTSANKDKQTRAYFQADGTWYVNAGGQHTFKGGIQVDRVGNDVDSGELKNLVRIQWNRTLSGQRGTYGYYQVRSNGTDPSRGFMTFGSVHTNNIGLFFQDAWTVNNKLTINAGIRTEQEKVPTYVTGDPTVPKYGVEWGFKDKLAPRVGFAYDLKGDGRWKAYGSWGIFYDIFKLELPRGSWGGDRWLEYYYTLDTFDYNTLLTPCPSGPTPSTPCSGRLIRGPIDFRHVGLGADYVEPDLKPMQMQEAAFGFDHQLAANQALGVRYVHKHLVKAIEDTGALDANQNEIYIIANPGFGLAAFAYPGVPYPKAKRQYDSVEFTYNKLLSDNWSLRASYMWSRLWGNYSGLSQSDENGRTSPNVGRVFDYPLMMFDEKGQAVYGLLPTDRPHQVKVQALYVFDFGTSVGANFYGASGLPVTRELGVYPPNNLPVQYKGRLSDGRTPVFSQTDIYVQHEFRFANGRRLQVSLNVLNLFNQKTAVNRFSTYHDSNGIVPDEALVYAGQASFDQYITAQGVVQNPLFLKDNGFQRQMEGRFGVKFIF
ncbi:MAG: carboxypeptidase regulatory-like domain-containing protein [Acidobacteriota bacterium]